MNAKPYVLADCDIPFLKACWNPTPRAISQRQRDFALRRGRADALVVRTRTHCDERLLGGTPVGLIATATIGHDHIDSEYCSRHGHRDRRPPRDATRAGCCNTSWRPSRPSQSGTNGRPADRTLGVVGVGNVGSLIAEYGELFGFRVLRCDPPKAERNPQDDYLPLGELLPQADIVTCHVPLNRTGNYPTLRMASASFFEAIKPGAIFINTSRGKIVDDEALIGALQSGRLSHAVVDHPGTTSRISTRRC